MRAKEIFEEPARIAGQMRELVAEIAQMRLSLLPGGIDYSIDRVQGGEGSGRTEAVLDKIAQKEKRLEELDARRVWLLDVELPRLMEYVTDPEGRQVLNLYYRHSYSIDRVGQILYISRMTVYRRRDRALEEIDAQI